MSYNNLREFIERLEREGELVRVAAEVSPVEEIAELTDRMAKQPGGGKAILFERTGTDFPVVTNLMGSERRMVLALGVESLDGLTRRIDTLLHEVTTPKATLWEKLRMLPLLGEMARWMPRSRRGRGPCQEVVLRGEAARLSLLPVLKCDAYGLGAAEIARVLEPLEAVAGFAVAHVSEGLALRNAGITKGILVMSSALPWQLSAAVEANLTLACGRVGFASELQAAAEAAGKPAAIHIKIDTGLHRIGFAPEELGGLLEELKNAPSLRVAGTFSHFSDTSDAALCAREYAVYLRALDALRAAGIEPGLRHVACSAASEQYPEYCLDAVRVGRRLFMDAPTAPRGDILEVSTWRSFVTMVHPRRAGEQIGYGGAVTLAHDALIATVGVGYGDGLNPALASAKAPVLIGRKRCTLLACCMDQCLIDVTGTDCRPGDEVVFFGYDRFGNCLPSQEVALLIGGDEGCGLTAALSPRVVRAYSS